MVDAVLAYLGKGKNLIAKATAIATHTHQGNNKKVEIARTIPQPMAVFTHPGSFGGKIGGLGGLHPQVGQG
jgi:hypothetical protein